MKRTLTVAQSVRDHTGFERNQYQHPPAGVTAAWASLHLVPARTGAPVFSTLADSPIPFRGGEAIAEYVEGISVARQ